MTELLKDYTFGEIVSFVVTFAIATKGFVTFWDWGVERFKKMINKQSQKEKDKEAVEEKIERNAQQIADVAKKQEETKQDINTLTQNINLLIQSDKDSIKAYITKEHHYYCYKQGWIDDYTLDCIEKRYGHYKKEGGNSFIGDLMAELRDLPKQPPQE